MPNSSLLYITENIAHLLKDEQIIGHYIYDVFGENLGRVNGLLVDRNSYFPRYLVYTQGGVLSTVGKTILAPHEMYETPEFGKVKLLQSLQWIKDIPAPHDIENLTVEEEELVLDYYNLPVYWEEEEVKE